jgi:hypothetical protein
MGKRLFIGLICCFFLSFQVEAALNNGLVAYYGFDGNANDLSGNNHNGTLMNGANFVQGRIGKAVSFDGVNDYVNCGNDPAFNILGEITLSAWVYPREGSRIQCLISKFYSNGRQDNPFDFRFAGDSSLPKLMMVRADAQIHNYFWSTQSIPLNSWSYVAVTVTPSGQGSFYINGQYAGGGAISISPTGNTHEVWIGRRDWDPELLSYHFYNGLIDEMRIYNRALTQDEIISLYQIPEPTTLILFALGTFQLLKRRNTK